MASFPLYKHKRIKDLKSIDSIFNILSPKTLIFKTMNSDILLVEIFT